MRKIGLKGKYCLFFLLLVVQLYCIVDGKKNTTKRNIDAAWTQVKTKRIFARQKLSPPMESRNAKCKPAETAPTRHCGPPREGCPSSGGPCCGPCSFCRCRFFNAVCRCLRMKPPCLMRKEIPCKHRR
ncbi:agouti-signaling protein 2b [Syngnathoides biaculeatus]|uniref:agouti-signaling protein 2b n=1 Tax=Syngnathoides biaculeatus TaxID=300417 RepID=UPI002ADE8BE5|nr:agouti-signaling protein 2b [Syngnathoides biaculeatus]